MSLDVCVLAGGRGTRLAGLWDGPKCLVWYKGRPLIEELVNRSLALGPRKIYLLLGHQASQVVAWREGCCPHRDVVPIIETESLGTAGALRNVAPLLRPPVLVLNGDTLPFYELGQLIACHEHLNSKNLIWHWQATVAWHGGAPAGAAVLSERFIENLIVTSETDLAVLLTGQARYHAPGGFLDVGTPEGFKRVQHLKGYYEAQ